jgi:Fe-Mn family superoxide dismutase
MPAELVKHITESCSSVESLRAEFIATANAMFGPGFVWLVKSTQDAKLKILCTYIAGSPYPAAHFRSQPVDMATQTTGIAGGETVEAINRLRVVNRVGSMGPYSKQKVLPPGGIDVQPILCVNTWEHVWLQDWGVAGKAGFLEAWWDKINWEEVTQNYRHAGPDVGFKTKSRYSGRHLF